MSQLADTALDAKKKLDDDRKRFMITAAVFHYLVAVKDREKPNGHRGIPVEIEGTCFEFIGRQVFQIWKDEGLLQVVPNTDVTDAKIEEYVATPKLTEWYKANIEKTFLASEVLQVFAKVLTDRMLKEGVDGPIDPDEGYVRTPYAYRYDPRFPTKDDREYDQGEDFRLRMIQYLNDVSRDLLGDRELDPFRVVFIDRLLSDEIDWKSDSVTDNIFLQIKLGKMSADINGIIDSQYRWEDLAGPRLGDEGFEDLDEAELAAYCDEYRADWRDQSARLFAELWRVGMIEQKKFVGQECGVCQAPLAIADEEAAKRGVSLDACPNPNCLTNRVPEEYDDERYDDEVVEVIETVEEEVYERPSYFYFDDPYAMDYYGGYVYDPYDYAVASVAGACLVGAFCYDPFYFDCCW